VHPARSCSQCASEHCRRSYRCAVGTGRPSHPQIISIGTRLSPRISLKVARARRELEMHATTSCGTYYSSWSFRCYTGEHEHESLTSDMSRAWLFNHHERCFPVQHSGVAPQCLAQAGPLSLTCGRNRTIGKTCMHLLTGRLWKAADVRWHASASPVHGPHNRVPIVHTVHFAGADGVLRLLPVPVQCIRDERRNGSRT
jgi:hypothetical protein